MESSDLMQSRYKWSEAATVKNICPHKSFPGYKKHLVCSKCERLPTNIMPDGLLLTHSLPICQSTVMTPIGLAKRRNVMHSVIGFNTDLPQKSSGMRGTGDVDIFR